MATPLLSAVDVFTAIAKRRLIRQTHQVNQTQAQFLETLVRHHEATELGQAMGLDQVHSVADFRQRVPIWTYSEYEPYFQRVAQGEHNVVTPDPVVYINMTSGSTGRQKLVPVTQRSKKVGNRANHAAMGFGIAAAKRAGRRIGRMLLTTPVKPLGLTEGGIPYGHTSGGNISMVHPFMYQQICAQPLEALLIPDAIARIYVCLLFGLRDPNLGMVAANFPVLGLQICEYMERYGSLLVDDLAQGTIGSWLKIDPTLRQTLEQRLRPDPKRAAVLKHYIETEGRLLPKHAWPNLALVVTAKGGTSDFYLERYPDYFGDTPVFGGTYAASEATFGAHYALDDDGTVLAVDSAFFEFVPVEEWDNPTPKTLLPHEVQVGEFYRILVTNYSGFYRYDIGDVVEVTGFYNQAPLVVFRHRRGGLLSATTEKTTEYHITKTMQVLQSEFDVRLEDFCITLSENLVEPYYLVNIELAPGDELTEPERFIVRFDEVLKDVHASYGVKRMKYEVREPELRLLAAGSFAELRQRSPQPGVANAQMKLPHTSEDRNLLADFHIDRAIPFPVELAQAR